VWKIVFSLFCSLEMKHEKKGFPFGVRTEPLIFGGSHLLFQDQEWIDAYIHFDEPKQTPGLGTCLIMEYWGTPELKSDSIRFRMDGVGLEIPDEGRYCEAYNRRAQADERLKKYDVIISCEEKSGITDIQITHNNSGLSENVIYGMVQEIVTGAVLGPWEFEVGLLNQN
jgi:hypothetical protein